MSVRYENEWRDRDEVEITLKFINTIEKMMRDRPYEAGDKFLFSGEEVAMFIKLMPIYKRFEEIKDDVR